MRSEYVGVGAVPKKPSYTVRVCYVYEACHPNGPYYNEYRDVASFSEENGILKLWFHEKDGKKSIVGIPVRNVTSYHIREL